MSLVELDNYREYQTCPKCTYRFLSVRYCDGTDPECDLQGQVHDDHLHIECERCSYRWAQKTAS